VGKRPQHSHLQKTCRESKNNGSHGSMEPRPGQSDCSVFMLVYTYLRLCAKWRAVSDIKDHLKWHRIHKLSANAPHLKSRRERQVCSDFLCLLLAIILCDCRRFPLPRRAKFKIALGCLAKTLHGKWETAISDSKLPEINHRFGYNAPFAWRQIDGWRGRKTQSIAPREC